MATPVLAATNTSTTTPASTTATVNLPSSISAGNLLIIYFSIDSDSSVTTPAGWTLLKTLLQSGSSGRLYVFYKVASGSEGATVAVTQANKISSHISHRITGQDGTLEVSTGIVNPTGDPNPDSYTSPGGDRDALVIAVGSQAGGANVSAYPSGYSNGLASDVASSMLTMVATKAVTSATENPGAFTTDGTDNSVACTVYVGTPIVVSPSVISSLFSILAPSFTTGVGMAPSVISSLFSVQAPTVSFPTSSISNLAKSTEAWHNNEDKT